MAQRDDEFQYIDEELKELGLDGPAPSVRRDDLTLSTGTLGTLVWGEHPEIAFLHGGGLNAHTWDSTVLALGRPAIAIDLPGHGDSSWRDDFDYSPQTNAVAVAEALDALVPGVPQNVVGQSLGGLTGIALAGSRPDLVKSLVIVDVSPGIRFEDSAQVRDFLAGPQVFPSREDIVEKALAAGIGSSRRQLERGVVLNTRVRDDGTVVFKHHLANPPEGVAPSLGDFTTLWDAVIDSPVPVLLVRGSHGFLPPDVVAEFTERVPRAIVVEIEAGHNVHEQKPAELAAAIGAFLDSH